MTITIEAAAKEVADLVAALQSRQVEKLALDTAQIINQVLGETYRSTGAEDSPTQS